MRLECWVEYAADDLRGRVKFLHNRRARWTPAVPQPEQDAQREQLRWSHSLAFPLPLRNALSFLFHLLCIPISVSPLSLNLFLLPCCLTSTVPLVHTFALSLSLTLPYSQLFALARSLSFCAKRELKASQHSSVVRPGTSSWIEVFKLVITCAALNIVLLYLDAEDALS